MIPQRNVVGNPRDWSSQISTPGVVSNLTSSVPGSASESRYFDFFRSQTLPVIDDGFRSAFWDRLVFQISAVDPAVRSAVVALAACHREQIEGGQYTQASTDYYLESIKSIRRYISTKNQGNPVLILCCCVIFTAFEIVRGNGSVASLHLQNGLRILTQYKREHDDRFVGPHGLDIEDLVPVFVRLSIQSRANLRPIAPESSSKLPLTYPSDVPASFKDLTQARDVLSILYEKGFSLFQFIATANETGQMSSSPGFDIFSDGSAATHREQPLNPETLLGDKMILIDKLVELRSHLSEWTTAFENTVTNLEAHSPTSALMSSDLNCSLTLRIHLIIAQIVMSTCTSPDSTAFDAHTQAFRDLVSHADRLIHSAEWSHNSISNPSYSKSSFSLDLGIVNPLRWVVTSCRHRKVRRDALDLLKFLGSRREGSWSAATAAKSAEWAIAIEEGRVSHESELWYTDIGQLWIGGAEVSPENCGTADESRLRMGGNEFVGLGIEERGSSMQQDSLAGGAEEDSSRSRTIESKDTEESDSRQGNAGDDPCEVVRRIRRLHTEIDQKNGRIRLVPIFESLPSETSASEGLGQSSLESSFSRPATL